MATRRLAKIGVLYDGTNFYKVSSKRIKTKNTHGTGCTYAAAIAAGIAKGYSFSHAVKKAKEYIDTAIRKAAYLHIGKGHGPLDHFRN